jgi:hypothetical protein
VTTITKALPESAWVELLDQQGRPCACAGDQLCLSNYGVLDPGRRARARRDAGIRDFEGRR